MMSSNVCVYKHKLKNKATSNVKTYQVFSSLCLNDNAIYLRDGPLSSDIGKVYTILQKEHIGLYTKIKNILIFMAVHLLENYPSLLNMNWILFLF